MFNVLRTAGNAAIGDVPAGEWQGGNRGCVGRAAGREARYATGKGE